MSNCSYRPEFNHQNVTMEGKDNLYRGFYELNKYRFTHALYHGGNSQVIEREIIERCNAVGVLPYDPVNRAFVMIEQIRIGAMATTDSPWLLECVAGMIEPGEEKTDVCIREAEEEAGLQLTHVIPMTDYLVSPGASTERLFIYLAAVDSSKAGGVFGLPEEGEDILVKVIPEDDMYTMLVNNQIDNAACLIALQHFFLRKHEYVKQLTHSGLVE